MTLSIRDEAILLTRTEESDLPLVVAAERHPDNAPYITPWPEADHRASQADADALHLAIRDADGGRFLGFVLLQGLAKSDRAIELKRLVVTEKDRGTGRRALRLLKQHVFQELGAHRLWLDVKDFNAKAIGLYRSEGFTVEGTMRDCIFRNGRYESLVLMSLLAHEQERAERPARGNGERPSCITHYGSIQGKDDSHYKGSDELLSIGSPFGRHFGLTRLGIHHEVLRPGRRTSWPHAESTEEEFVYVIEGYPRAWIDGEIFDLVPGDGVGFPAGTGIAHTFINDSAGDVRLLVVGESTRPDNKIHYPMHPQHNTEINYHWHDVPARPLGSHDGLPEAMRNKRGAT